MRRGQCVRTVAVLQVSVAENNSIKVGPLVFWL